MKTKQLELLNKLKELSKRGIGGEKENSTKLLDKLLKKYNITIEALETLEKSEREIKYSTLLEKKLINQVLYSLFPKAKTYFYMSHKRKKSVYIELSNSQYIEFRYLYSIYKKDFKKELDYFYTAFINKNNIFPDLSEEELSEVRNSKQQKELSLEEQLKLMNYSSAIDKSNVRKALSHTK